jgi:hypothetical protein
VSRDVLEIAKHRSRLTHEQVRNVVGDLSDEQLAWRPTPRAHSIGWTLWHIARCADRFCAQSTGADEIWEREGLAAKWQLPEATFGANGVGTGVDDETAATLRPPSKDVLFDYMGRSFSALDAFVAELDAAAITSERQSLFFDGPAPIGRSLIACIAHENRHLGELEYVKGLLGLRGTATR